MEQGLDNFHTETTPEIPLEEEQPTGSGFWRFLRDVLETLVPQAFEDAIKSEKLVPMGEPELADINYKQGEPLSFKAILEIRPEVEVKDYTGFDLERKVNEVTDADVDKMLSELQERHAELEPVERDDGVRGAGDNRVATGEHVGDVRCRSTYRHGRG